MEVLQSIPDQRRQLDGYAEILQVRYRIQNS